MEYSEYLLRKLRDTLWNLRTAQVDINDIFKGPEPEKDKRVKKALSLLNSSIRSVYYFLEATMEDDRMEDTRIFLSMNCPSDPEEEEYYLD